MRRLILFVGLLVVAAVPVQAQSSYPTTEIYGGYSYLSAQPIGSDRTGMHGWGFSFAGNFGSRWGGVAEFSGHYGEAEFTDLGGTVSVDTTVYTFLFGPRISARGTAATGFGHVLVGGANLRLLGGSRTDFAMAIGGGVDINAGDNFAIRVGQVDYLPNRMGGQWNSDFRFQAGVVVKLGGL
jgi:opacity protein-like surface antigen